MTFSTRSSAGSLTQYKPSARQDSLEILQQCLDLPVIQNYFTRHSDGTLKQVYIMQYPVKFPDGLAVSKFGRPVLFRSRADMRSEKAEVFLIVKTFSITGDDASVNFTLNSDYTTKPNILEVTVQLHRSGQTWAVSQKQIRRLI
ncbi:MAG: hypothetical protein JSU01_02125 [Bacteroidetes bacterium]|nr:hypothetical protein [Bacteroidota bacterium]